MEISLFLYPCLSARVKLPIRLQMASVRKNNITHSGFLIRCFTILSTIILALRALGKFRCCVRLSDKIRLG